MYRTLGIDGPLFKGRYKAQLIDDDCYRLFVSRYIHLNPLVAGIASIPANYRWSSYSAYLGLTKKPLWLSIDAIKNQLPATKLLSHVKDYRDYVEKKTNDEINIFTSMKHTPIVGSEPFKKRILSQIAAGLIEPCLPDINRTKRVPDLDFICNQVSSYFNISHDELLHTKSGTKNISRLIYMYICRKQFGHTLRSIPTFVRLSRYESVSNAIQKCQVALQENVHLAEDITNITTIILSSMPTDS